MGDDLFKDCDCGDCNCDFDFDCCDCDCNCDDCLPGNNFILICCCITPAATANDPNRTNRDSTPCFPCCCCVGRSTGRRNRQRRKQRKKKGFCCWRLWCCFARNDPSPPPSPARHGRGPDELSPRGQYRRDGRYPMEDLDFYMNDRRARHHELDMPPRGYKSGGRHPMPEETRMYRDEYYGPKETRKDYRSSGGYGNGRRDDRWAKREDVGKADKYGRKDEDNTRRAVVDVPPKDYHGPDHRQEKPDELDMGTDDYGKDEKHRHHERPSSSEDDPGAHEGHQFQVKWSSPVKYDDPGRQTKG